MPELNVSPLFDTTTGDACFLANISLSDADKAELMVARKLVRDELRACLPVVAAKLNGSERLHQPKFFTQGSYSYKTIHLPLLPPQQQMDLDDGIYLPVDEFRDAQPTVAADIYIRATDLILDRLANDQGWRFSADNPNCSRLVISHDKHIDVPRYCMPYAEYERMLEAKARNQQTTVAFLHESYQDEDSWDLMPQSCVLMAHRKKGWIQSDPRPFKEWVEQQANHKGSHFRKVIKILKGWRDYQEWSDNQGIKSILLMAAIDQSDWLQHDRRIDKTLLHIVKQLPDILAAQVPNPIQEPPADDLAESLDNDGIREETRTAFQRLAESLSHAIEGAVDAERACKILQAEFGERLPYDPARVITSTVEEDETQVLSAAPFVPRTNAG